MSSIALFDDLQAYAIHPVDVDHAALASLASERRARTKVRLPLFNCRRYGGARSSKGSLRHDPNVVAISGVEGDYDAGAVSLAEAAERLRRHDVAAVLYSSPSSTKEKPRWRVTALTSEELEPAKHGALLARLNGALGGVLADESFDLSRSYYIGHLDSAADFQCEIVEGRYIDRCDDLDAIAESKRGGAGAREIGEGRRQTDDRDPLLTLDQVTDILRHVDCSPETVGRHADAVPFYASMRFVLGREGIALPAAVEAWGLGYDGDAEWLHKTWSSLDAGVTVDERPFERVARAALEPRGLSSLLTPLSRATLADDFGPVVDEQALPQPGRWARFKPMRFGEIRPDLSRRHLVKNLIPRTGTVAVVGEYGARKSQIVLDLGVAIAAGLPWCDRKVMPGLVIYSAGEGVEGIAARLEAIRRYRKLALDIPFVLVRGPDLRRQSDVDEFIAFCGAESETAGLPVRLVVEDTLTSHTPGMDENAQKDMSTVVANQRRIVEALDCVVMPVHHFGKNVERGARGSTVLSADLDTELHIEADADVSTLRQHKQRDMERGAPIRFRARSMVIGVDGEGDIVTAPYVEPETELDLFGDEGGLAAALGAEAWRRDWRSDRWVGVPMARVLGLDHTSKADRRRVVAAIDERIGDGTLVVERVPDSARHMREWVRLAACPPGPDWLQ